MAATIATLKIFWNTLNSEVVWWSIVLADVANIWESLVKSKYGERLQILSLLHLESVMVMMWAIVRI